MDAKVLQGISSASITYPPLQDDPQPHKNSHGRNCKTPHNMQQLLLLLLLLLCTTWSGGHTTCSCWRCILRNQFPADCSL
jgi:hypothetical protein